MGVDSNRRAAQGWTPTRPPASWRPTLPLAGGGKGSSQLHFNSVNILAAASKSRLRCLRRAAASASSPHLPVCQSSSTWAASQASSAVMTERHGEREQGRSR